MVEDARERLTERDWRIDERFALNGFSASATFTTRFATLHPDRVSSVSAGGLNGMGTLPIPQIEATALEHADIATILGSETLTLDYPVGIADLAEITGEPFDLDAFRTVDRFLYMGGEDRRDSLLYPDAWTDTDLRAQAILTYGEDVHGDRFTRCAEVYEEVGAPAVFGPSTASATDPDRPKTTSSRSTSGASLARGSSRFARTWADRSRPDRSRSCGREE